MANTFARTGTALQRDQDGAWQSAATGVRRDSHYTPFGRAIRLEQNKTNYLWPSESPVTRAYTLAAGDYCVWLEGAGSIVLSGGPTGTVTAGNPVRFTLGGSTAVTLTVSGGPTRAQLENGPDPTSYIVTTTVAVTRLDEQQDLDFPSLIQPMTLFLDCCEVGRFEPVRPFIHIGKSDLTVPSYRAMQGAVASGIQWNLSGRLAKSGLSQDILDNGAQLVDYTQHLEIRYIFNANGSHGVAVSRNGGAESTMAMAGIMAGMPTDWSTPTRLFLGRFATAGGLNLSVLGFGVAEGIQTRDVMRTLVQPLAAEQPLSATMAGVGSLAANITARRAIKATMAGKGILAAAVSKVVPVPQESPDFVFLRLEDPAAPASFRTLNVIGGSWVEEPTTRMGQKKPAFDGTMLSTQRTPKRAFSCTVEFRRPQDLDDLLDFIALDDTQPYLGARPMKIRPPTGDYSYQGPLRSGAAMTVDIEVGRMRAQQEVRRATGTPGPILTVTSWAVDLTFRQI